MNALLNNAISPFVMTMRRSGLLTEDLDCRLVRASMVIMYFFFGYQKWWPYEVERLVPFISNGPLIWWMYPVFGHPGASWFLGVSEWTFGGLLLAGLLGQAARNSRCRGLDGDLHRDRHDYPFHARRLGFRGRISSDDRQRPVLDERRRAAGRLVLSAETGRGARHPT